MNMLLRHPTIYVSADGARTHAMLVRDGVVVALGEDAVSRASADDEVFSPDGACVFPALCDAHIHLWGLGLRRGSISLVGATTTGEVYETLREYDLENAPGGWALGRDWDQHRWADSDRLDIARLDELFGETPVVLRRIDGHALWVNTAALRRAQISDGWDPGPNGHVGRDDSGQPNGLLVDDAMNPVLEVIPPPTVDEDREVFLQSCEMLKKFGCTAAHVAWMPLDRMKMITDLHAAGELPLRLHLLLDGRDPNLEDELARGPRFDDWLNIAGVKFFADGALGSKGAHLLEPYSDGTHGLVLETTDHLTARSRELAARGWQVAVHAIGDAAARSVLDAFAAMDHDDRARTRPRIEHCQTLADEDVARFGELGVTASVQAIHMYSDAAWAVDEHPEPRLRRLFRWAELLDVAPCFAGGSDYPIEDPNPWHGISTSVSRLDRHGREFDGHQRIPLVAALASYTDGAAWASFREGRCGRLNPGFLADFIVLDADPFESDPDQLWNMNVLHTAISR